MQVLVTGAAGFMGAALVERLLARGDSVIGIDNCNDYYDPALKAARLARLEKLGGDFTLHKLDFADMTALEAALENRQVDRIVHLGAQAGVRYSLENPQPIFSRTSWDTQTCWNSHADALRS